MLLKGGIAMGGSEERPSSRRTSSGLSSTGTTTTVSHSNGKSFRNGSKMAVSSSGNGSMPSNMPRIHRKAIRTASKRFPGKSMPGKLHTVTRMGPGKIMKNSGKRLLQRPNPPICDNSNDSGLGFDNQEVSNCGGNVAAYHHAQLVIGNGSSHRVNGTGLSGNSSRQPVAGGGAMTMPMAGGSLSAYGQQPGTSLSAATTMSRGSRLVHDGENAAEHLRRRRAAAAAVAVAAKGPTMVPSQIQMDSDDACSNDAFMFAQQQRQLQFQCDPMVTDGSSPGSLSSLSSASPTSSSSEAGVNEILAAAGVTTAATTPSSMGKSCGPRSAVRRQAGSQVSMQQQGGTGLSKNGRYQLQILAQPEQQHRARYQTEGSRGAVKDRSGNSFPIVRLQGYDKPAVLEVFIGTDVGRVAPHMFYQACKVSGKNSTPCMEKKVEGTMIIELDLRPEQEMMVTCDCVGILKERNVDVEHRFPEQSTQRSKKKSTRCRMVFRATITHDDGTTEQLQVCSQPIICTQPPGVPEICKKSLISCPVLGGFELFVIGKNFAKDTKMIFQSQKMSGEVLWQEIVSPDKEYLQQTHLICTIPPYVDKHIRDPVTVQLYAMANGRKSEYHNFVYTPKEDRYSAIPSYSLQSHVAEDLQCLDLKTTDVQQQQQQQSPVVVGPDQWGSASLSSQENTDCGMMPPPNSTLTLNIRRSSSGAILSGSLADQLSPSSTSSCSSNCSLKVELHDESSQGSLSEMPVPLMMPTDAALAVKQEDLAVVQQLAQQHHNLLMNGVHMGNQVVQVAPSTVPVAPIQFTDQQLTTISQAINATTTNPATSSVMDVGGALHMDTNGGNGGNVQPVNLMAPNCSASDIILNSHSAILGATTNLQTSVAVDAGVTVVNSPNGAGSTVIQGAASMGSLDHGNLSPEVILNPTVTPSLLCDTLSGSAVVPVVPSTVVPSMVVDPMMSLAPTTIVSPSTSSVVVEGTGGLLVDPMLSANTVVDSMMCNSPTSGASLQSPQSPNGGNGLATTAEVVQNVQNMILNAAAEILVSQQTTISNESMQAIISLNNAASMLNDQQQQGQAQVEVVQSGIYSTSPVAAAEDPNMAMMVRRNSNILTETGASQAGGLLGVSGDIHMRTVHEEIGHLGGSSIPMNTTTSGIVVNDLMVTNSGGVTAGGVVSQAVVGVSTEGQSALMTSGGQVVDSGVIGALNVPMMVQGSQPGVITTVVGGAAGGEVKAESNPGGGGGVVQQQQPPPASIPQEIATMSEHDLISYINPNCFEQEFQNI